MHHPSEPSPPVRFESRNGVLIVTLDRPRALNALDFQMALMIDPVLAEAAKNPDIACVIIEGAGGKAFCAGGDVRAAALSLKDPTSTLTRDYFLAEYRLNQLIHRYPKPFIALVDGICMGGGLGLSVHGSHRIVSEKLVLAMPETGIGLFPDVGGGWFLNQWPGETGAYMALSGARLSAADAVHIGYATQFVPTERFAALRDALIAAAPRTKAAVDAAVQPFIGDPGPSALAAERGQLDHWFAGSRIEEILDRLERDGSERATELWRVLNSKSPTSLKISLALIRRARGLAIEDDLILEYRMSQHCMAAPDFYEGIRALLIDKDNFPVWNPHTIDLVTETAVEFYFSPLTIPDISFARDS